MTVRYTATASVNIAVLLARIGADNPGAASAVAAAIKTAVDRLAIFPRIGSATDADGVYMRVARPYRYLIFYSIVDETVFVLSVRHPARRRLIR
jgi:plasmid stabilization system protein ParE